MDEIPWATIGLLTPSSLLMLTVWMILTGRLVPRYLYEVMVKAKEQWRQTAETLKETTVVLTSTNAVQASTIEKQSVVGHSVIKVMGAIEEVKERGTQ